MINNIVQSLKKISPNARVMILSLPLFSIPNFLYSSFATLYMMELGISATRIGYISSATFAARLISALCAGQIINKIGRKRANVISDIMGWLIPITIWIFADNFVLFLIAGLFNSITSIGGLSSQFLLIEDTSAEERIHCFNYMEILNVLSGFVGPVTGYFIVLYRIIPTLKGIYTIALCCMILLVIIKATFLRETSVGQEIMLKPSGKMREKLFVEWGESLVYVFKKPILMMIFIVNIIMNFNINIGSLYYVPLLTKGLGYSEQVVSMAPFITSAITLLVLIRLVPKITDSGNTLIIGFSLYIFGALLLILIPSNTSFLALIFNIVCWAFSKGMITPVFKTLLANKIDDEKRATVMSFFNSILMLSMLPAGIIGGILFEYSPKAPFVFLVVAYTIGLLIFVIAQKNINKGD